MTIREKIVEYLKDNNQQSIKEISGAIQERENVVRTKIYDKKYGLIAKGIVVNVAHIGRRNYFSLKENVTPPIDNNETSSCFLQYNILFNEVTDHIKEFGSIDKPDLIILAKETLDIDLIKKKEKELGI